MRSSKENTDRLGLDANILIYAFDKKEGKKHELCKDLMDSGFRGLKNFAVPMQSLAEFYAAAARGRVEVSPEQAKEVIGYILALPNFLVVEADMKTLFDAMDLNHSDGNHFWDCMLTSVLVENGISKIYTENTKDFSGIEAVDPFK